MYKATIFYFSGTGNTWRAADKIKKLLDARNINADTVSIDSLFSDGKPDTKTADWLIKSSDLLFFGWPIYGSDLPQPMKDFIDSLNPLKTQKHVHTFCTQLKYSGDGAWLYHKNFEEKNLVIDSCVHFIMPSNVSVWRGILGPPKTEEKAKKILAKCDKQIEKYIRYLLDGKARKKGSKSYPLGIIQRAPYRALYKGMQDWLSVDTDRCIKCGKCAAWCPVDNIKMNEFPEFLGHCALCLRCYSYCPSIAVKYRGKTHNTEKYGLPYRLADKRFSPDLLNHKIK